MNRFSASLLCSLLVCGCQRNAIPDPPEPLPESEPPPLTAAEPVMVPTSDLSAPYMEAPERGVTPSFGRPVFLTMGEHVSVHRTGRGLFAVHSERGVLGPLALPEQATNLVVDEEDAIWLLARDGGVISRASDAITAQKEDGYKQVAAIPGALTFDVNAGLLAVGEPTKLHISKDGGASFEVKELPVGYLLNALFVRHDGVMVLLGVEEVAPTVGRVYISHDSGESFTRSEFHPQRLLRTGSWIWNGDANCVATLSRDGKHWSSNPSLSGAPGYKDPRNAMLTLSDTMRAPAAGKSLPTLSSPLPPADVPDARHVGLEPTCQDPIPTAEEIEAARERAAAEEAASRGPQPIPCSGAQCIRGFVPERPPETRHQFWLVADGHCKGTRDRTCEEEGAEVVRTPHLAIFDRREDRMALEALPEGCVPERLFDASGMALLVCRGEQASVYTRTVQDDWVREIDLEVSHKEVGAVSISRDGTLMLHGVCERDACAPSYLRAPVRQGLARAWTEVDLPEQLSAVPFDGGGVLVMTAPQETSSLLTFWYAERGKSAVKWFEIDGLDEPVRGVRVRSSGKLELLMGDDFQPERHPILGDGPLKARL